MDRYITVMVVPEREKGIKSFRIPRLLYRSLALLIVALTVLLGVFIYDYWKILGQVFENKHLAIENRQLKEQIQLFQTKLNALSDDITRIRTFEKKLRIITGVEHEISSEASPLYKDSSGDQTSVDIEVEGSKLNKNTDWIKQESVSLIDFNEIQKQEEYQRKKKLYEAKIASDFGLQSAYEYTKDWSDLTQRSFALSHEYASIDYKHSHLKDIAKNLELDLNSIDTHILDRDSFLKSTPTILPVQGWVTSYYGMRMSPTSGRVKMHEGIDIGAPLGSSILAPADGVVTYSGSKPGFGYFVQIDHGYGIETIFGHNRKNTVKKGQEIKRGNIIAKVGNTGSSTGPHVHYEVRVNGIAVDPLYFILN